jgi:hypothetical protein
MCGIYSLFNVSQFHLRSRKDQLCPSFQPPDQAEKHMSQREREPERQHTFYNKPIPKRHVWGSE